MRIASFVGLVVVVLAALLGGGLYFATKSAQQVSDTYSSASSTSSGVPQFHVDTTAQAPAAASGASSTNIPQHVTKATLHTSMGDITIELNAAAPNTVANFVKLAQSGYYDGVKFHRVIKGFMDQAGDPLTKDDTQEARWGTGGPGYTIPDENMSEHNGLGVVSMANTGAPNSGGSQFFINAADNGFLDGKYAVFGKVTAGLDVVAAINNAQTDSADRPTTAITINSVTLE